MYKRKISRRQAGKALVFRGIPPYAISRLGWIRDKQKKLKNQARETPRKFVNRESHYLWGRRHLMTVAHGDTKPFVALDRKRITLTVRPGSDAAKRAEVVHARHKSLLHEAVPLIEPMHSDRFVAILGKHYPTWREARAELNKLPLTAETWNE